MTMPRQKKYPDGYVTTGVVFEPEVMAFIRRLAREEERNQSTVINRIIRDFAQRSGAMLPRHSAEEPGPLAAVGDPAGAGADEVKTRC